MALPWVFRLLILPPVPLIDQLRLTCVLMFPSQPCESFFPDPFPIPLFVLYTVSYRTRYLPPCTHTIVRVFCFVGIYKQCSLAQATCITLSDPRLPHELPPSAHEFWGLGGGLCMDVEFETAELLWKLASQLLQPGELIRRTWRRHD